MKVVTWNVNSVQSRLSRILDFLQREEPEVLCLQEIKCLEEKFPFFEIEKLGYHCAVLGQKTYNGVAFISRSELSGIEKGMNIPEFDKEARLISARLGQLRLVNVYVPNGQTLDSEKYQFKIEWLKSFNTYLERLFKNDKNVILCGDFNIAPDDLDVCDPKAWNNSVLTSDTERKSLQKIMDLGFLDLFREKHKTLQLFSWWDYRQNAFSRNHGLRIDLILGTSSLCSELEDIYIDSNERRGSQPSDHAPVVAIFKNPPMN